jgi:dihydrofolate reductase
MAKLIVVENVSLDGVMQSPGRPDEDIRDGFAYGGWATERLAADPEAAQAAMSGMGSTRAMLFGHRTYDDLVGHWLGTTEPNPFTDVLRNIPKYVASRDATTALAHPNSELLAPDGVGAARRLKGEIDGDIVVLGSGMLVRELAAAGLIDEYVLTIIPVVLGTGVRLFAGHYAPLSVRSSTVSPTGIIVATYAVDA